MNETKDDVAYAEAVRDRRIAAVILLLVAGLALAGTYLPFSWRDMFLVLMGLGFILWSAIVRSRGLLVPGGVLMGMGVGVLLRDEYGRGASLLSLAGGFLLIAGLSLALFGRKPKSWWPLWPAGVLTIAGLMQIWGADLGEIVRFIRPYWPFALIGVALYLLFTKPKRKAEG